MLCVPLGIEVKFKNMVYPVLLAPRYIPELHAVTQTEEGEFRGCANCHAKSGDVIAGFIFFGQKH